MKQYVIDSVMPTVTVHLSCVFYSSAFECPFRQIQKPLGTLSMRNLDSMLLSSLHRELNDPNQQWGFSPTGHVYCLAKPSLVLTCVTGCQVGPVQAEETPPQTLDTSPSQSQEVESKTGGSLAGLHFLDGKLNESIQNDGDEKKTPEPSLADLKDVYAGQTYAVVVLEKFPGKHPSVAAQR